MIQMEYYDNVITIKENDIVWIIELNQKKDKILVIGRPSNNQHSIMGELCWFMNLNKLVGCLNCDANLAFELLSDYSKGSIDNKKYFVSFPDTHQQTKSISISIGKVEIITIKCKWQTTGATDSTIIKSFEHHIETTKHLMKEIDTLKDTVANLNNTVTDLLAVIKSYGEFTDDVDKVNKL